MRDPRFVKWLADAETVRPGDFAGLHSALGRLVAINWGDEQSKQAAEAIYNTVKPAIERQQSLMKNVPKSPETAKAETVADINKQILKISDYADKVRSDPKLSATDRKKKLAPLEQQMQLMQGRRDSFINQ